MNERNIDIRNKYLKLIELAVLTFTAFVFIFMQVQSQLAVKISLVSLLVMIVYCVMMLVWNMNFQPQLGLAHYRPYDAFLNENGELIAYVFYLIAIIFMAVAALL